MTGLDVAEAASLKYFPSVEKDPVITAWATLVAIDSPMPSRRPVEVFPTAICLEMKQSSEFPANALTPWAFAVSQQINAAKQRRSVRAKRLFNIDFSRCWLAH